MFISIMFWKPSESGTFSIARGTFPSTLPISSTGYTNGCSSLMVDTLVLLQFLTEPKFNKKISQLTTIESWAQTLVLFRTLCPCTFRIFSFHISNAYRRLQFYIWMHPIQMRPKRQRLCSTDEKKNIAAIAVIYYIENYLGWFVFTGIAEEQSTESLNLVGELMWWYYTSSKHVRQPPWNIMWLKRLITVHVLALHET